PLGGPGDCTGLLACFVGAPSARSVSMGLPSLAPDRRLWERGTHFFFGNSMNKPSRRACAFGLLVALLPLALLAPVAAQTVVDRDDGGYQLPAPALQALVDAPRQPQVRLSPDRNFATMLKTPALPGIDVVAQPELKLAGTRINPHTYDNSRFSFGSDVWLLDIANQQDLRITGLPADLALADQSWSPDQRHIAFTHVDNRAGKVELWLVDVASRKARRLLAQPLNGV